MLLNALRQIGFTQQEALLYILLCQNGELTGYEAAKISGISRSNVYAALASLTDKGYAHLIEGVSTKYIAVPGDELIRNAERDFKENISIIQNNLVFNVSTQEPYITISGEKNILSKIKNIIEISKLRIYVSCGISALDALYEELKDAIERGLKIVILAPQDLKDVPKHIYYPIDHVSSFKLISDTKEVIAGNLTQCLYSKNTTLVSVIRESFINEISVIETKLLARGEENA